jgi:hypothetical protein
VHCMLKWLNLINKIKMLILIFELSKFPIITFYLCENLSLKTQEIKFPSPSSIPRSSFIREDFPDHRTYRSSLPLSLVFIVRKAFVASMFLVPASACNPIRNDCKASSSHLISFVGSILEPSLFLSSKNSICFQISINFLPRAILQRP